MIHELGSQELEAICFKNPYYLKLATMHDDDGSIINGLYTISKRYILRTNNLRTNHVYTITDLILLSSRFIDMDIDEFHMILSLFTTMKNMQFDIIENNHRLVYLVHCSLSSYRDEFVSFAFLDDLQTFWFFKMASFNTMSDVVKNRFFGMENEDLSLPVPVDIVYPVPITFKELMYVIKRISYNGNYPSSETRNFTVRTEQLLVDIMNQCVPDLRSDIVL